MVRLKGTYLPNALTVNNSLVLILEKTSRETDRPDQTGPERSIGILDVYEGNEWNE